MPDAYKGREPTYLKHRALREYATSWGFKLGSLGHRKAVRLCYVDGFAGPWRSRDENLADTSIATSLTVLEGVARALEEKNAKVKIEAAFIEKDAAAFSELDKFLRERTGRVTTVAYRGLFSELVPTIGAWLGQDAALIFVDPTGWKDIPMQSIAPLVSAPRRDVMVNVMFEHINRFKDARHEFLRKQMRDLFGLGDADLPEGLSEEELFALYRTKLKEVCGVTYAADIPVPHPTAAKTKFRLVVGGKNTAVLEVFRDVERKVAAEAGAIYDEKSTAKDREVGQLPLGMSVASSERDAHYEAIHRDSERRAPLELVKMLTSNPVTFAQLWPRLLEDHHLTLPEARRIAWNLHKAGAIAITNVEPREKSAKDTHLIALAPKK